MKNIEAYINEISKMADTEIKIYRDVLQDEMYGVVVAWSFRHYTTVLVEVHEDYALVTRYVDGEELEAVSNPNLTELFDNLFVLTSDERHIISEVAFAGYADNLPDYKTQHMVDRTVVEQFGTICGDIELVYDTRDYLVK